jgi:hypothetical protein
MEKWLMKARFSQPIIGVLAVDGLSKQDFGKIARGPSITPSEWVDMIKATELDTRLVPNLKMSLQYQVIVNPLGESYPEEDIANMTTFKRIRDYIRSGGIFVNINGLAFWYMWNSSEKVELLTGSPLVSYVAPLRLRVPRRRHNIRLNVAQVPVYNPDVASIIETLLFHTFGIRTTVGDPRVLKVRPRVGFEDLIKSGDNVNEFRAAIRSESPDCVLYPLLTAQYQYSPPGQQGRIHQCYPIAAVKCGLGYLVLMGISMNNPRDFEFLPSTIQAIRNKLSQSGLI